MRKKKKKILIISNYPPERTSTMHRFIHALAPDYNLTITCKGAKKARELGFPVRFLTNPDFALARVVYAVLRRILPGSSGNRDWWSEYSADSVPPLYRGEYKGCAPLWIADYVLRNLIIFLKHLIQVKPDLIFAFNATELWEAMFFSRLYKIPYWYVIWETWSHQQLYYSRKQARSFAYLEKTASKRASGIVVDDYHWRRMFELRYKIPRANFFEFITCPPAIPDLKPAKPVSPMKFLYQGLLIRNRGLENLILAIKNVENAHLALRGFGVGEESLKALVQKEGLSEKVSILPPLPAEELVEACVGFDVGIIIRNSYRASGRMLMGFKFFEYMAGGLAIMGMNSLPISRFTKKHKVGITYKSIAIPEIEKTFQYCVDNPDQVWRWKQEAYRLSQTEFNAKNQEQKLKEFIDSVFN